MAADNLQAETVAVTAGRPDQPGEPLNVAIHPTSNYLQGGEREYSRGDGTPTIDAFEAAIGALEGGWALAFASGMAAASAVFDQLPRGAIVVVAEGCYQGVAALVDEGAERQGWEVKRVASADTDRWLSLIDIGPDLVWLESPSNPMLEVADVPGICSAAAAAGVTCAVDNTFATPLLQRPLDHGATYSIHSATKFIGGHSDLLGGLVVTADPDRRRSLEQRRLLGGATIGALEAFLALRGLRTLPVRLARSQASAADLAHRLAKHSAITTVRFPGLATDPGYTVAKRTLSGPGAVLSFETTGTPQQVDATLDGLSLIRVATSLGGVESTLERRARLRGQNHVPATLIRLSVGCEHVDDLWRDLSNALDHLPSTEIR